MNPAYLHTTASAAFDWRPAADYARRGGLYKIARHHYADRDSTYSFSRLDAEVVQHIPILRENWVISLRGRLETTLDDDDQVPYFLLPSLGSGSTLRGYSSWRFRDRHACCCRASGGGFRIALALDMAFFYDTGMVAPRLDAIALGSFVSNFGVGVRFHGAGARRRCASSSRKGAKACSSCSPRARRSDHDDIQHDSSARLGTVRPAGWPRRRCSPAPSAGSSTTIR